MRDQINLWHNSAGFHGFVPETGGIYPNLPELLCVPCPVSRLRKCWISFQSLSCPEEPQALFVNPHQDSCCPPKPGCVLISSRLPLFLPLGRWDHSLCASLAGFGVPTPSLWLRSWTWSCKFCFRGWIPRTLLGTCLGFGAFGVPSLPQLPRGLGSFYSEIQTLMCFPHSKFRPFTLLPAFHTSNYNFSFRLLLCLKFIFPSPWEPSLKTSCFVNNQELCSLL